MSVQSFNPSTARPVQFTEAAVQHLKNQVERQNAAGIYFKVKEAGCSGYKYLLEIAENAPEGHHSWVVDDCFTLFVSDEVLPLIRGTTIDYVTQGVNSQLKFTNPNATGTCGCGESFSVTPDAAE